MGSVVVGIGVKVAVATAPPNKGVIVASELGCEVEVAVGVDDGCAGGIREKFALTTLLEFIVMLAGFAVPPRSPDQPLNCQPEAALAVSWTLVPELYCD